MRSRKLKTSKALLFFAISATTLASSIGITAIATSTTNKVVPTDKKGNAYSYVSFKSGLSGCTFTGRTRIPVKPGKIFNTITDRPVASLAGYNFVCWSTKNLAAGEGSIADAIAESTVITQDIDVYPIFKLVPIESLTVIGPQSIKQAASGLYKALASPSYVLYPLLSWKAYKDNPESTEEPEESTIVDLETYSSGENKGKCKVTPNGTGNGKVYLQASDTQGSGQKAQIEITIEAAKPTEITLSLHTGSSQSIKVGGETTIDSKVIPTAALQDVTWTVTPDSTDPGSAVITSIGDGQVTIKGTETGKVLVKAKAKYDTVESSPMTITITDAQVTKITIVGPEFMDVKDISTFCATVYPKVTKKDVTWNVYDEDPTGQESPTASTIANIDTSGNLTVMPSANIEQGFKNVFVRATATDGSGVNSNVLEITVMDLVAFTYSYCDENGDRWIYDSKSLESKDASKEITMWCYDNPTKGTETFDRGSFSQDIAVGKLISAIGNNFLYNCTGFNANITFNTVGNTCALTKIGDKFMYGCSAFDQDLDLPSTIQTIGDNFMAGCMNFKGKIVIPEGVESVGTAFMPECFNISEIEINNPASAWPAEEDPVTLTSIDSGQPCITDGVTVSGTTSAEFLAAHENLEGPNKYRNLIQGAIIVEQDGVKYSVNSQTNVATIYGVTDSRTTYEIPETVTIEGNTYTITEIAKQAFANNETLVSVTVPQTVNKVGASAFYGCTNLTTVDMSTSQVTVLDGFTFAYCENMTTCSVPPTVELIQDGCFLCCSKLVSVDMNHFTNLTSIGEGAFAGCKLFTDGGILELPKTLTYIGADAFYYCTSLEKLVLNRFDNICIVYKDMFTGCKNLSQIDLVGWTEASLEGWNVDFQEGEGYLFVSVAKSGTITISGEEYLEEADVMSLFGETLSDGSIYFDDEGEYWTVTQ